MINCDQRWEKLAKIFCNSTKIKAGDRVLIEAIEPNSEPLLFAIYKEATLLGAIVDYEIVHVSLERVLLKYGNHEQLNYPQEWRLARMKEMDVYIGIRSRTNALAFEGMSQDAINARRVSNGPILNYRVKNTRWCITRIPTDGDAVLASMSTEDYVKYYFDAVFQDYDLMEKENQILKELMLHTDKVSIKAPGTDLTFSIKGMPVESCFGESNLPDGEVFTTPIRDSVNGIIRYNVGTIYEGKKITGISFIVEAGKIIYASCDQGQEVINGFLDTDEGSRYFGEFAIGTNTGITRPILNTIFDEKINGSFHMTPGSSHAEIGNKSAIHMDLVSILNPEYGGGVIEFDGIPVIIDGRFVNPNQFPLA